ncbi:hypothetical protein RI543_002342 [Arxiozyma heterogenica]|uniref:Uncharacterized protein n=1 Tax=Arxiozyma heterogenica TaxID=278026 RepID=A0AAN7ZXT4_9SACH|nr:hypothetical protein RI543_002342 [Kazachstania heterogenica]
MKDQLVLNKSKIQFTTTTYSAAAKWRKLTAYCTGCPPNEEDSYIGNMVAYRDVDSRDVDMNNTAKVG